MAKKNSSVLLGIGIVLVVTGIIGGITATYVAYRVGTDGRRPYDGSEDGPGSVEIVTNYDDYDYDYDSVPEMPDFQAPAGGPEADDGELHDARNTDVSYGFQEGFWAESQTRHLDAYDKDVYCEFAVKYPILMGDFEHRDEINALLKSTALKTVHDYYDDPDADAVAFVDKAAEGSDFFIPEGADAYLMSTVDYAVTYNNENLISVCYSDHHCLGSQLAEFIEFRTLNINLQTGEVYALDDALTVTDDIATSFIDNLVQTSGVDDNQNGTIEDSECSPVAIAGRDALVQALKGEGELAGRRVSTRLFIDGNGKPNLGVNYWVSGEGAFVRGWWDVTITDEQLEAARKECGLWELISE